MSGFKNPFSPKRQVKNKWGDHLHQTALAEAQKPLPSCETFPLDTGSRLDDTPDAIKRFLHQIEITQPPEPNSRRNSAKSQYKMSNPSSANISRRNSVGDKENDEERSTSVQQHKFTEMEIVTLWNRFKFDFPTGNVNRKQLLQLFRQVFPRSNNNENIVENLLLVFDPDDSGIVSFREMLILFSMSMDGTPRDKLHWAFRLYDQDGDDLLREEDMIDIFKRLWKLAENMDETQLKEKRAKKKSISEKEHEEQQLLLQVPEKIEKPEKQDHNKTSDKKAKPKKKVYKSSPVQENKVDVPIMSSRMSGRAVGPKAKKAPLRSGGNKRLEVEPPPPPRTPTPPPPEEPEETEDQEPPMDPAELASILFHSLDVDHDGVLTEEEFVEGCLTDQNFLEVLTTFNCDFIWSD